MKAILGVSNHSPHDVRDYIDRWKEEMPSERAERLVTQFLGHGHEVKDGVKVVLVPTLQLVIDNREALELQECVVIVFDSPIILAQAKISILDTLTRTQVTWIFHEMQYDYFIDTLRDALNGSMVASFTTDFALVPNLLNAVQGSLTQVLLNLTSRSRVPEKRREITTAYVAWLLSPQPLTALIDKLRAIGMDDQTLNIVTKWFQTPHGVQAKKICQTIAQRQRDKKPINYDKLCKGSTVLPYDLKFLMRHARTVGVQKIGKTSVEAFNDRKKIAASSGTDKAAIEVEALQEAIYTQEADLDIGGSDDLDFESLEEINPNYGTR